MRQNQFEGGQGEHKKQIYELDPRREGETSRELFIRQHKTHKLSPTKDTRIGFSETVQLDYSILLFFEKGGIDDGLTKKYLSGELTDDELEDLAATFSEFVEKKEDIYH